MKSPHAPAAPDPAKTAAAQTGMNIDTAIAQQLVNQTNQKTPEGSLSYGQTGNTTYTDSSGHTHTIPQFTATQTLSPGEQALYDTTNQTKQNFATLGSDLSAKADTALATPLNLSNDATEARLMDLGTRRLQPQWAHDEEALRTRLIDSGIRQGSDAWNTEMTHFNNTKSDALNQLLLSGHGQAEQDALTARNQPINEITALMSGSQVSQPDFRATPTAGVAGTDYAGMVQNQYAGQMAQYQANLANQQATMGGLFGLAGSGVKAIAGMPGANAAIFG